MPPGFQDDVAKAIDRSNIDITIRNNAENTQGIDESSNGTCEASGSVNGRLGVGP
jgi:hypothetical protein